ncbi:MAG: glycine cleavage system protein R [Gammaproteobacteria bacterium]
MKTSYLVISSLSADHPGIVNSLSEVIVENDCNIEDSRMTVLGTEFAVILLVSGKWNAVAKLETALDALGQREDMQITTRRTDARESDGGRLPYGVDVATLDQPGIVHHLAGFFANHNINIEDMTTSRYPAAHTGTAMFSVHLDVTIPAETHISALRDEFFDFCDRLNLDAVLEPIKS